MEEYKKKQLEILRYFHNVCVENNLKYSLSDGSAIGAIRHNGYIPWDDDIDVMMPREDYENFIKLYGNEDRIYFLQNYKTENNYPLPFSKLRDSQTTFIEEDFKNIDMNQGVFIDIFVVDRIAKNAVNRAVQKNIAQILWLICISRRYSEEKGVKKILAIAINLLSLKSNKMIIRLCERIVMCLSNSEMYYANYNFGFAWCFYQIPSDAFDDHILVKFEEDEFYIIASFDEYLRNLYGEYMNLPPENERINTHNMILVDCENSYKLFKGDMK